MIAIHPFHNTVSTADTKLSPRQSSWNSFSFKSLIVKWLII
jgi:hypothetical protein